MKLIKPNFEIITQNPNNDGMLKHIELCGRVCYKSEDKIKDNTAAIFVNGLIKSGHTSVLEHGTVYLYTKIYSKVVERYERNKYSKVIINPRSKILEDCYITTNYRVLVENNWLDDLQYQCEPTEFHEKRITVKFICTIGISREFNRHRVHSITEQSTRYCNYSKDKFGNEITFIKPLWYVDRLHRKDYAGSAEENYEIALKQAEQSYFALLYCGWKPERAREILPLNTATELIHTAFISDWKHFFELRCSKAAHPQAQELAIPLEQEFKKLNLI